MFSTSLGHFPSAWESPYFLGVPRGRPRMGRRRTELTVLKLQGLSLLVNATTTSISTAPPRGSAATPMAERVCRPASPNMS